MSVALDAISDRWSLHVVRTLAFGAIRFTDIVTHTGAPRDVLTTRLRKLTEDGIVVRRPYREDSVREGYFLTDKGRDLARILLVLKRWGDTYSLPDTARRSFVHTPCGASFEALIVCEHCREPVGSDELVELSVASHVGEDG
ncbi:MULTISPECIES: winged helix-turn-helix transcriptional regulator [Gordonia]|uniref:winged helix-turn-helix transcriptional regulator n=1 Tax=Gordonia TaxID=2053 RepID=UPI0033985A8F